MELRLTDDPPARFGAWLPGVEGCDVRALGLAEQEARMLDPQQRLLLEMAAEV